MRSGQRLDHECDITMGQAPEGESYNTTGLGLPLIAGAGDFGETSPVCKKFTHSPAKTCIAGDIVLGIRATIGEKVLADRKYCLGRGVAGLRAKPGLDPRYLWHWLTHSTPALARKAKGATFKQVNREDIGELPIILPPLPEQRRIAEVLDLAEALRAKRRAALAQLDTLRQSIFLATFAQRDRFANHPLASLCEIITDGTHYTPTYCETGVLFLSSKNVTSGYVDWEDVKFIPDSLHNELHRRVAPKKCDILLAKNGTTGIAAIVDRDCVFDIYVSLALLRASDRILPIFLREALNSPACSRQFNARLKGVGVPNLHLREIRETRIPAPPIEVQRRFVDQVIAIEKHQKTYRASLAELDALFASLQHRAFRGEL